MKPIQLKRIHFLYVMLLLIVGMVFTSCKKNATGVRITTFFDCGATFKIGTSVIFKAEIIPENARNTPVIWHSSNPSVATITKDGYMLTVGIGQSAIICATEDGKHSDTMYIAVVEDYAEDIRGTYKGTLTIDDDTTIIGVALHMITTSTPSNNIHIDIEHTNISIFSRVNISYSVRYDIQGEGTFNGSPMTVEGSLNSEATATHLVFTVQTEPAKTIVFYGMRSE